MKKINGYGKKYNNPNLKCTGTLKNKDTHEVLNLNRLLLDIVTLIIFGPKMLNTKILKLLTQWEVQTIML